MSELPLILITGLGRCGTSLMADFLRRNGYDPGGEPRPQVNWGWEDPAVIRINNTILAHLDNGAGINVQAVHEMIRGIRRRVVKDPRLTAHPDVIGFWDVARPIRVLLMRRDILACAASHHAVANPKTETVEQIEKRLGAQYTAFVRRLCERRITHYTLDFPNCIDRFPAVEATCEALGLRLQEDAEAIWEDVADWSKVHHE